MRPRTCAKSGLALSRLAWITTICFPRQAMQPPASTASLRGTITFIGISGALLPDNTLHKANGVIPAAYCPPVEQCPSDKLSIVPWLGVLDPSRRTYAMNAASQAYQVGYQIPVTSRAYPKLPTPTHGVESAGRILPQATRTSMPKVTKPPLCRTAAEPSCLSRNPISRTFAAIFGLVSASARRGLPMPLMMIFTRLSLAAAWQAMARTMEIMNTAFMAAASIIYFTTTMSPR